MHDLLYYLMLATLVTHELDAMKRHEWRILPIFRSLPEHVGEQAFIWSHIPLMLAILWLGGGQDENPMRIGLAAFSIVHIGLHWLLRNHPAYEFNNPSSRAIIVLCGFWGAAYLLLVMVS